MYLLKQLSYILIKKHFKGIKSEYDSYNFAKKQGVIKILGL